MIGNVVNNSFIPGIIVYSNAPDDTVSGTIVAANRPSGDGWFRGAVGPAGGRVGVIVAAPVYPASLLLAPPAVLTGTVVSGNRIAANEDIGICVSQTATSTITGGLTSSW